MYLQAITKQTYYFDNHYFSAFCAQHGQLLSQPVALYFLNFTMAYDFRPS